MKKRILAVVALVMLTATLFVGCSKKKCDLCGETKSCKTLELFGEKLNYCSDCEYTLTH